MNTTPHRAHFTHANIISRVAQGLCTHLFGVISQSRDPHSHRSCFTRSHPCMIALIFHFSTAHLLCFFLRTGVSTAIRTLEDSLADLLNEVISKKLLNIHGIEENRFLQSTDYLGEMEHLQTFVTLTDKSASGRGSTWTCRRRHTPPNINELLRHRKGEPATVMLETTRTQASTPLSDVASPRDRMNETTHALDLHMLLRRRRSRSGVPLETHQHGPVFRFVHPFQP